MNDFRHIVIVVVFIDVNCYYSVVFYNHLYNVMYVHVIQLHIPTDINDQEKWLNMKMFKLLLDSRFSYMIPDVIECYWTCSSTMISRNFRLEGPIPKL